MNIWQRFRSAWASQAGSTQPKDSVERHGPIATPTAQAVTGPADVAHELTRLRLDLEARAAELANVREEYGRLERQNASAAEAVAREAAAAVIRALAPVLSQLGTLRHLAESGREVRAADALKLAAKLEQTLQERGLERIGEVGAEASFDPALHQRMSGGDVRDGDPVQVRFVGYRFAGETPVKALVSRVGQEHQPE